MWKHQLRASTTSFLPVKNKKKWKKNKNSMENSPSTQTSGTFISPSHLPGTYSEIAG